MAETVIRNDEPLPDVFVLFLFCFVFFHSHFLTFPSELVTKIVESSGHI